MSKGNVGNILRRMSDEIRPLFTQLLFGAEAPCNPAFDETGVGGGSHIHVAVADIQHFTGMDIQPVHDVEAGGRVGLAGKAVAHALNHVKGVFAEDLRDDSLTQVMLLVGKDGQFETVLPEQCEKIRNALIRGGFVELMRGITGAEISEGALDEEKMTDEMYERILEQREKDKEEALKAMEA